MSGRARGSALLELVVASAGALLVVAMVAGLYPTHAGAYAGGRDRQELRATLRRVTDGIVREVRSLGFDPVVAPGDPAGFDGPAEGLAIAEAGRIEIRSDHHGAGAGDPPNDRLDESSSERTAFQRSAGTGGVTQRFGNFTAPLTEGIVVPPGGLRFRYFDACGAERLPPLDGAARRTVGSIAVELSARHAASPDVVTVTARTALRNRRGLRCEAGA